MLVCAAVDHVHRSRSMCCSVCARSQHVPSYHTNHPCMTHVVDHVLCNHSLTSLTLGASLQQMGKPRGIRCGRKMRTKRRLQKWNDLDWNKSHSLTHMKANPFGVLKTVEVLQACNALLPCA